MAKIKNPIVVIKNGGSGGGLAKYHIVQTITGNTCTIAITDYTNQASDNAIGGAVVNTENNTQKIYLVEEQTE